MGQRSPHVSEPKTEEWFDQLYLANGELFDETVPTYVFYSTIRVDWYPWWQRGRTGATSSLAMVAWRRCTEVRRLLLDTAMPGEKRTGSAVTKRL